MFLVNTLWKEIAMSLPIEKMLVLSTSHIELSTNDYLSLPVAERNSGLVLYDYEYGYRIWTGGPDAYYSDLPDDLRRCMQLARACECDYLVLDSEGETIDFLPQYEWPFRRLEEE